MALGFLAGLKNKYFRAESSLKKLSSWKKASPNAFKPILSIMEGTGSAID